MSSKMLVDEFVNRKTIAVVGVSADKKKFGASCYSHLKERNYNVIPVNPHASEIDGEKCYPDLLSLPDNPDAALIVVPKSETEKVVKQAHEAGINMLWIQQQSETKEALDYCAQNNIKVISGECVMMFAEPVNSIHKVHRFFNRIFGKLPA